MVGVAVRFDEWRNQIFNFNHEPSSKAWMGFISDREFFWARVQNLPKCYLYFPFISYFRSRSLRQPKERQKWLWNGLISWLRRCYFGIEGLCPLLRQFLSFKDIKMPTVFQSWLQFSGRKLLRSFLAKLSAAVITPYRSDVASEAREIPSFM